MKTKSILKIGVTFLALTFCQTSFAEGYFGIGAGTASWDIKPLFGAFEVDNGTTIDILIGTRGGNLGFEGELTYSEHDWKGTSAATHNATNLILAGLGFLPISSSFELYGKVGMDLWTTSVDFLGYNYEGDDGVSLVLGAGVIVNITDTFGFRVEYKTMSGLGDGIDEGDMSQTTLLAVFKF